jgi:hypothetical protein
MSIMTFHDELKGYSRLRDFLDGGKSEEADGRLDAISE